MVAAVGRAAAILEQQALEAAIVGLAHGGVHADVGGDAGQGEVVDAALRRISSRSVAQNEPLPGLSMIGLAGAAASSSGMISQPGSPRTRMRPQGPGSPMPAPMRRERQRLLAGRSDRSGRWPSRVWMIVVALCAQGRERALDRPDRRAGERKVVTHLVDVAADAAEVGLHEQDVRNQ